MIQVIERFHQIMLAMSKSKTASYSMSELAALLDVSVPTCSNIVKTMVQLGYLRSLGVRQNYVMGDTPYFLSRHGEFQQSLIATARPVIQSMIDDINEDAVLITEYNKERCTLLRQEGKQLLQVKEASTTLGLTMCPTGCILLSGKSPEERREHWDKNAGNNCLHVENFEKFNAICDQIYSEKELILDDSEITRLQKGEKRTTNSKKNRISDKHLPLDSNQIKLLKQSVTMGFPIFRNHDIVASLGLIIPMVRFFLEEDRDRILQAARKTVTTISQHLNEGR